MSDYDYDAGDDGIGYLPGDDPAQEYYPVVMFRGLVVICFRSKVLKKVRNRILKRYNLEPDIEFSGLGDIYVVRVTPGLEFESVHELRKFDEVRFAEFLVFDNHLGLHAKPV